MNASDTEARETRQVPANLGDSAGTGSRQVAELLETRGTSLNESPFVSYSLNFEDVILHRLFPGTQTGFFVDVGAGHPRFENDMFAFYQRGWRGINIEPNHGFHAALMQERPRDTNLRVALSDSLEGELTYYELNGSGLSTCDPGQGRLYQASGRDVVIREVPVTTLSAVLAEAGVTHINILKVDVEGFEEKVLNGNDWERFRPDVVVVEATYPESPIRRPTNILSFMEQRGYRHAHFDGLNDFYLERESATPEALTLPPNVFDRFVPHVITDLRNHAASFHTSLIAAEGYAQSLKSQNADLRRNADALATDGRRIEHENAQLSFENHRLRRSAEQMRDEVLMLNRLLEPLHVMSEQLNSRIAELEQLNRKIADAEASIKYVNRRKLFERLFFRLDGRPVKPLRRLLFHTSGEPRRLLRVLVHHKNGAPRTAFAHWMGSREYLDLQSGFNRFNH